MSSFLTATDWHASKRPDGSIFMACGGGERGYHMAFDIALEGEDDLQLAQRFCEAMNAINLQMLLDEQEIRHKKLEWR